MNLGVPLTYDMARLLAITEALRESVEAVKAMPPEQRRALWKAQQRSWVIGEFMLAHPEISRAEAEEIYNRADQ